LTFSLAAKQFSTISFKINAVLLFFSFDATLCNVMIFMYAVFFEKLGTCRHGRHAGVEKSSERKRKKGGGEDGRRQD